MSGLTKHELVYIEEYLRFHQAQDDFLAFCQTHMVESSFVDTCAQARTALASHAESIARFLTTTTTQS